MRLFGRGKNHEPIKTVKVEKPKVVKAEAMASKKAPVPEAALTTVEKNVLREAHDAPRAFARHRKEAEKKAASVKAGTIVKYAVTDRYSVDAFITCTHADGTVDLKYKDLRVSPNVVTKEDVAGGDGSETGTWYVG